MGYNLSMMRTGVANLPLHAGRVPPWLFKKMKGLSALVLEAMIVEHGPDEVLRRLSDPYWFQAFCCVLGFDWHSSGLTTTVCGAMKEALKERGRSYGLFIAGGKGATSRKTPLEIEDRGALIDIEPEVLIYSSRLSAKIDSACLQDGYELYHHTFVFTKKGRWAVIQQGMNPVGRYARRYHWLGRGRLPLGGDFVCEPHSAVCSDRKGVILNMVAEEGRGVRSASVEIAGLGPDRILDELKRIRTLDLPPRHHILARDIEPERLRSIFISTYESLPADFEGLVALKGVGAKTMRALALLSELIYGTPYSVKDPVRFSFAHGGKDGHPHPVDRACYKETIQFLHTMVERARLGYEDKTVALRRLSRLLR